MSTVEDDVIDAPSQRREPWEEIGKKVNPNSTPEQMLVDAGLNWSVEKVRYNYPHNGSNHPSSKMALVRSSDSFELTTITGKWEPVQNLEAFMFFDEFVRTGNMRMHAAGSLYSGRIVFALAEIAEPCFVFGGDRIDPYFLFTNFHEYGRSTDLRFTPIRFECGNSLVMALSGSKDGSIKINHRRKFDPEIVKKSLGLASEKLLLYKSTAEYLGSKRADPADVISYLQQIFPSVSEKQKEEKISRPARTALKNLETQPGAEYAKGSWWQAVNAVTYTIDHLLGKKQETRIGSAWYGPNRVKKYEALEIAGLFAEKSRSM